MVLVGPSTVVAEAGSSLGDIESLGETVGLSVVLKRVKEQDGQRRGLRGGLGQVAAHQRLNGGKSLGVGLKGLGKSNQHAVEVASIVSVRAPRRRRVPHRLTGHARARVPSLPRRC